MQPVDETLPAPTLPPQLPPEVTHFACVDHGGYCARGYNPCQTSGRISGIPIAMLTQGQWLGHANTVSSGSTFIFHDKNGKELGRAFKASLHVIRQLESENKWPQPLVFRPAQS